MHAVRVQRCVAARPLRRVGRWSSERAQDRRALRDAVAAISSPVMEVHITNIHAREEFRHTSLLSPVCKGVVCGLGLEGYAAAIRALIGGSAR